MYFKQRSYIAVVIGASLLMLKGFASTTLTLGIGEQRVIDSSLLGAEVSCGMNPKDPNLVAKTYALTPTQLSVVVRGYTLNNQWDTGLLVYGDRETAEGVCALVGFKKMRTVVFKSTNISSDGEVQALYTDQSAVPNYVHLTKSGNIKEISRPVLKGTLKRYPDGSSVTHYLDLTPQVDTVICEK